VVVDSRGSDCRGQSFESHLNRKMVFISPCRFFLILHSLSFFDRDALPDLYTTTARPGSIRCYLKKKAHIF